MREENPPVQAAICSCGNWIMISVVIDGKISKASMKEFSKLMSEGYEIKRITLEQARLMQYCNATCESEKKLGRSK